jgi:hypothetical protein
MTKLEDALSPSPSGGRKDAGMAVKNVVASWSAMRRKPSISWVYDNWPVP